jgi:DNA-binding CsgD family transcriptional regulator
VQSGDVPLLGRDQELARLRAFLADAAMDGGCLVLSGEPGVGKSALLDALAQEARSAGSRVLRASGVEFEADLGFSALNQLLVPLHREFDQLDAVHRGALSVALGFGTGSPAGRLVVSTAVLRLLRQVAELRPLVLVVDDLPWLDRSSAAVLRFVARRLAGTRIGLLAAARTCDGGFEWAGTSGIELRPLDDEAAAELLTRRFPTLPARVRQHVLEQARGNPLALTELPDAVGGRVPDSPTDVSVLALGGRLRALFTSRVSQLPAPTRRLLLFAALHGAGDLRLLQAAGQGRDGLEDLTSAERARLVVVDDGAGRFDFRHPLIRSAVVEVSTSAQRRQAHRELATHLADQPERRAWHLAEAAVEPDEQVADLLEQAGQWALQRGDAVGAVAALLRAADLSPWGADRGRRLAVAAYVGADVTGQLHKVPQLLFDSRRADPELHGSLEAAVAAAYVLINGEGDVDTAHRLLVGAIDTRAGGYDADDRALTEALHTLLTICWFGGRPELWAPFHTALARLKPRAPVVLSLCAATFADPVRTAAAALGELDATISGLHDEADPARIVRIGMAAFFVDRMSACRQAHWRVVEDGRRGGAVGSAVIALIHLCLDDLFTGQWDEAQSLAEEGLALCDAHGYQLLQWPLWFGQAALAAARGDEDRTRALTDNMIEWAAPRGVWPVQWYSCQVRALAALGRGDFEYAYQQLAAISPPGALASHVPIALWGVMDLVEAAVRTNRHAEARAHVAAMAEARIADLSPRLALLVGGSAALAAGEGSAAELFDRVLATSGAERWAFEHARVQLAYGERLRRSGAMSGSRAYLAAALDTFTRLGARPWVDRATEELRATGHRRHRAGTADGDPGRVRLTPQERQIATLAASGLTNKQIAEQIFLSPRTVSAHLYRIFPKLGITSRAALRDALAALPADASDQTTA